MCLWGLSVLTSDNTNTFPLKLITVCLSSPLKLTREEVLARIPFLTNWLSVRKCSSSNPEGLQLNKNRALETQRGSRRGNSWVLSNRNRGRVCMRLARAPVIKCSEVYYYGTPVDRGVSSPLSLFPYLLLPSWNQLCMHNDKFKNYYNNHKSTSQEL